MARELTINFSMAFNKSGLSTSMQSGTQQLTVSGSDYARETMTVPTSITALPLGSIATPGYCMLTNKDATNFVEVYTAVAGAACIKLKAGEWAAFRFAGAAPAVKANTAPVKIDYLLIAD
jgi:hypothetical protein